MRNLTMREMNGCVGGLAKFPQLEFAPQPAKQAVAVDYKFKGSGTTSVTPKYRSFAISRKA